MATVIAPKGTTLVEDHILVGRWRHLTALAEERALWVRYDNCRLGPLVKLYVLVKEPLREWKIEWLGGLDESYLPYSLPEVGVIVPVLDVGHGFAIDWHERYVRLSGAERERDMDAVS